jgi:uncharacterized protein YdaL
VSADDYEFWNIVACCRGTPTQWALGRYRAGLSDLKPTATTRVWEAPHYHALRWQATTQVFKATYQRVVYFTADKFGSRCQQRFRVGQIFRT